MVAWVMGGGSGPRNGELCWVGPEEGWGESAELV